MLSLEKLTCLAGGRPVVQDVTIDLAPGLLHAIVGPNGSGKSTLLKAIAGGWPVGSGSIRYEGEPLADLDKGMLARRRALMSQLPELYFPLRVDDIVMMGRYPHFAFRPGPRDIGICREAMERLSVLSLAGRDYLTLSGGERQRVQFARALAQVGGSSDVAGSSAASAEGCRYLFLDEPVSSLDIYHEHHLLGLARELAKENIVLVVVLHDLNLALQYADRLLFLKQGRLVAAGTVPDIIQPELIREVFRMEAHLLANPYGRQPVIVYGEESK
jgi:heme transport system ATP-binding protein